MKKVLFILPLVLVIAMIYGYRRSVENRVPVNSAKQTILKDFKGANNPDVTEAMTYKAFATQGKAQESRPNILLILTNYNSKGGGSTSFLHNYLFGNPGQPGC